MTDQIEDKDDELEIEIVDDTPEPDKGKPKAAEEPAKADTGADDDDLEDYSDKVKKRINKLKYESHAERRAKEEAIRAREEAIAFAARVKEERDALMKRLEATEDVSIGQAKQRVATQLEQAKAAFKAAYEAGDADALADAQLKMSELKGEEMRLASFKPQRPAPQQQQAPQSQAQQAPRVPEPSDRAKSWAQRNPWFGKDEEMTGYAYGVHERVIKSGVAPDSEEYYTAIDSAVRRVFADKFEDEQKEEKPARKQMSSPVAPAGRQTSVTPRKVVLSSTQVALAKRLGLTNEQYAAQLLKDSSNG
jgi:hypothetical protein